MGRGKLQIAGKKSKEQTWIWETALGWGDTSSLAFEGGAGGGGLLLSLVWASQLMFYISATLFLPRFSARLFSPRTSPFLPAPHNFCPFFAHFTPLLPPLFLKLTSVGRRRNINGPKWKRGGDSTGEIDSEVVRLLTFNLHARAKKSRWERCWVGKKGRKMQWNWKNWTAWSNKNPCPAWFPGTKWTLCEILSVDAFSDVMWDVN